MPLYAGVCETDITPPVGLAMGGYSAREAPARGVHDPLFARALVLEDGLTRLALVVADWIGLNVEDADRIRDAIAAQIGTARRAVLLQCTHTHAGPCVQAGARETGPRDPAYLDVMTRKLIGAARQAADDLQPATLTYGEATAQIGVNRRQTQPDGATVIGADYGGPVAPLVQTLCVNGADGRTFALLFAHACHPTTLEAANLYFSADWPGAAVAHLKARFLGESAQAGIVETATPIFLQACGGDINPYRRGTWEAVGANGREIADAAHAARWNAHGRLAERLDACEITLDLPVLPFTPRAPAPRASNSDPTLALPSSASLSPSATQPFVIQKLTLGGVTILGFPAEMFVQYQLDFAAQSPAPVLALGGANGCLNYVPTSAEYARGGYEINEACHYYGRPMFAPACEALVRRAVYRLLELSAPDETPYPLQTGRPRP